VSKRRATQYCEVVARRPAEYQGAVERSVGSAT
jgi:hypothetical protein